MKRLLIATDSWHPKIDGVVKFLDMILPGISREFEITILAPEFNGNKTKNVVRFETSRILKLAGYKSVKFSFSTLRKVKKHVKKSDIVWSQDLALLGMAAIVYGRRYKKFTASYVHQITWEHLADILTKGPKIKSAIFTIARVLARWLYNKCDLLMVPSKKVLEIFDKNKIRAKKEIVTLGVDTREFSPPENKNEAKLNIGINPNKFVIGYVGRLSKEKNVRTLHMAFVSLKEKYEDITLLIVGGGKRSDERALKTNGVIVTGIVKKAADYFKAMDLFVLPSLTETTSLATMEAMACGIPVIVTPVGSLPDYVEKGKNGYFFPCGDVESLKKRIEELMLDDKKRVILGANARKKMLRYKWEDVVNRIVGLLS